MSVMPSSPYSELANWDGRLSPVPEDQSRGKYTRTQTTAGGATEIVQRIGDETRDSLYDAVALNNTYTHRRSLNALQDVRVHPFAESTSQPAERIDMQLSPAVMEPHSALTTVPYVYTQTQSVLQPSLPGAGVIPIESQSEEVPPVACNVSNLALTERDAEGSADERDDETVLNILNSSVNSLSPLPMVRHKPSCFVEIPPFPPGVKKEQYQRFSSQWAPNPSLEPDPKPSGVRAYPSVSEALAAVFNHNGITHPSSTKGSQSSTHGNDEIRASAVMQKRKFSAAEKGKGRASSVTAAEDAATKKLRIETSSKKRTALQKTTYKQPPSVVLLRFDVDLNIAPPAMHPAALFLTLRHMQSLDNVFNAHLMRLVEGATNPPSTMLIVAQMPAVRVSKAVFPFLDEDGDETTSSRITGGKYAEPFLEHSQDDPETRDVVIQVPTSDRAFIPRLFEDDDLTTSDTEAPSLLHILTSIEGHRTYSLNSSSRSDLSAPPLKNSLGQTDRISAGHLGVPGTSTLGILESRSMNAVEPSDASHVQFMGPNADHLIDTGAREWQNVNGNDLTHPSSGTLTETLNTIWRLQGQQEIGNSLNTTALGTEGVGYGTVDPTLLCGITPDENRSEPSPTPPQSPYPLPTRRKKRKSTSGGAMPLPGTTHRQEGKRALKPVLRPDMIRLDYMDLSDSSNSDSTSPSPSLSFRSAAEQAAATDSHLSDMIADANAGPKVDGSAVLSPAVVARPVDLDLSTMHQAESTSCHQCRRTTFLKKMRCSVIREDGTRCKKLFCCRCITIRYPDITFDEGNPEFVCPYCKKMCSCTSCCTKRGEAYVSTRYTRKWYTQPRRRGGDEQVVVGAKPRARKSTAPKRKPATGANKQRVQKMGWPNQTGLNMSGGGSIDFSGDPSKAPTKYWGTVYTVTGERVGSAWRGDDSSGQIVVARHADISPLVAGQSTHKAMRRVFVGAAQDWWGAGSGRTVDRQLQSSSSTGNNSKGKHKNATFRTFIGIRSVLFSAVARAPRSGSVLPGLDSEGRLTFGAKDSRFEGRATTGYENASSPRDDVGPTEDTSHGHHIALDELAVEMAIRASLDALTSEETQSQS